MNTDRRTFIRLSSLGAAAAMIASACGGDSPSSSTQVLADAGEAVQQIGPVEVSGTPLPPYVVGVPDLALGTKSPVIDAERFDGSAATIGAPTTNPTMYVFLAHWCPACNAELPVLVGLAEQGRFPEELDIVGVTTVVVEERPNYPPSEWLEAGGWPFDAIADGKRDDAYTAMGGDAFPFTVIVDTDGTVLARWNGKSTAEEELALIDLALAQRKA